jgi:hypothetical protein
MSSKRYSLLGWVVWQIAARVVKKKIAQNRAKLGAAGVVALVLVGGIAAARRLLRRLAPQCAAARVPATAAGRRTCV